MRFMPKNLGDLHTILIRLHDEIPVEASPETGVSAKSVSELKRLASWPSNLVVETPDDPSRSESTVKISLVHRMP